MYESVKQIEKLRQEKLLILNNIYESGTYDTVYKNQDALGHMAMSIYTDVGNAILAVLHQDGVGKIVWPNISIRLDQLSFVNIPSKEDLQKDYNDLKKSTSKHGSSNNAAKPNKVSMLIFFTILAAQGITVPLILNTVGRPTSTPIKILKAVNIACMVGEIMGYFDIFPLKHKKDTVIAGPNDTKANYEAMCKKAINEIYINNKQRLNAWFDALVKITEEEISKAAKEG